MIHFLISLPLGVLTMTGLFRLIMGNLEIPSWGVCFSALAGEIGLILFYWALLETIF